MKYNTGAIKTYALNGNTNHPCLLSGKICMA
jgi:hypothetical protein